MKRDLYRDSQRAIEDRLGSLRKEIEEGEALVARLKDDVLSRRQTAAMARHLQQTRDAEATAPPEELIALERYARFLGELRETVPQLLKAYAARDDSPLRLKDFEQFIGQGFVEVSKQHLEKYHCKSQRQVATALERITDKVHIKTLVRECVQQGWFELLVGAWKPQNNERKEMIWATFLVAEEQFYLTFESVAVEEGGFTAWNGPVKLAIHARVPKNICDLDLRRYSALDRRFRLRGAQRPRTGNDEFDSHFMVLSGDNQPQRHLTVDLCQGLLVIADRNTPSLTVRSGMAWIQWIAEPDELSIRGAVKALRSLVQTEFNIYKE